MKKLFTNGAQMAIAIALLIGAISAANAQNKKLLGMTAVGKGIFELDLTTFSLAAKTDFSQNPQDGLGAHGSLIKASDGKIYGMTYNGGINAKGVIFEYNPQTGINKAKHQFDGTNGENPYGSLCDAGNGKLYGMTSEGGANNNGVLFEYVLATGTFAKIMDFKSVNPGSNGGRPYGSLMKASNGKLYGMTSDGGDVSFKGVIFELNPVNNQFAVLAKFGGGIGKATSPKGDLVEAHNGKLYGLAGGGTEGLGCVFEFDIATNTITVKYEWKTSAPSNGNTARGAKPEGSLCLGKDSLLYGLTTQGGSLIPNDQGPGVVFTYNTITGEYIKKKTLDGVLVGSQPKGSLMQASNGKFYAMNYRGQSAQNKDGGIFEYDAINDTIISRHFFNPNNFQDAFYGKLLEIDLAPTAIGEKKERFSFNLFPNPANKNLSIELPSSSNRADITIFDIQGKIMKTETITKEAIEMNIESLSNGVYFISIETNQGTSTQKFIKN